MQFQYPDVNVEGAHWMVFISNLQGKRAKAVCNTWFNTIDPIVWPRSGFFPHHVPLLTLSIFEGTGQTTNSSVTDHTYEISFILVCSLQVRKQTWACLLGWTIYEQNNSCFKCSPLKHGILKHISIICRVIWSLLELPDLLHHYASASNVHILCCGELHLEAKSWKQQIFFGNEFLQWGELPLSPSTLPKKDVDILLTGVEKAVFTYVCIRLILPTLVCVSQLQAHSRGVILHNYTDLYRLVLAESRWVGVQKFKSENLAPGRMSSHTCDV